VLVIDVILLAGGCWMTTHVRDSFERLFADFEAELPALTTGIMAVPGYVFVTVLLGIAALLVVKEIVFRDAFVKLVLNLVAGVGLSALGVALTLPLYMPLVSLMEQLR